MIGRISRRQAALFGAVALTILAGSSSLPPAAFGASAGGSAAVAEPGGKAGSVAALAKRYDSGPCAECHKDAHAQWKRSTHASSFYSGGTTAAALGKTIREGLLSWPGSGIRTVKEVRVEHLMICAKCHLPQLADATDEVAREIAETVEAWQAGVDGNDAAVRDRAAAKLESLNIGCLVCHNRNAVIHKQVDGFPDGSAVYGSKEGAHPGPFARVKKGASLDSSIFCGQCHGYGPNLDLDNPVQCATDYGSHLFAYVADGGRKSCQDCHMRRNGFGHDVKGAASPDAGKDAVDVSVDAYGYIWRNVATNVPRVVVEVRLTNRAGHAIPAGPPSRRHLVLETVATGGDDNAFIFTGRRGYRVGHQRLGRGKQEATGPHDSSGIVEDRALPPERTVRERFDFLLPSEESLGRKISIRVRLLEVGRGSASESTTRYEFRRDLVVGGAR